MIGALQIQGLVFSVLAVLLIPDCLYALQATIPHLTRSSLHRCLQRHGISRLPEIDGASLASASSRLTRSASSTSTLAPAKAGVRTAKGKLYLFVAIDRVTKFAFVQLPREGDDGVAGDLPHAPW